MGDGACESPTARESPGDSLVVNHKDGNKSNNRARNLEYVTHQQNCWHAVVTQLRKDQHKVVCLEVETGRFVVRDVLPFQGSCAW